MSIADEPRVDDEAVWRLSTALASSTSSADVAESVAREGGRAAGASFANMGILDPSDDSLRVAHRTEDVDAGPRWSRWAIDDSSPMSQAVRTGLPVLLGSLEEVGRRFPEVLADVTDAGLVARATLPLFSSEDVVIGALGFGWAEPQGFSAAHLRRLDLIAQLTAHALERAVRHELQQPFYGPGRRTFEVGTPISPEVSARWFETLYEMPILFSGMLDRSGTVIDANALSVEGCGLVRQQVIGRPFWECGWWAPDPDLVRRARSWVDRAVVTGEQQRVTTPYFLGDGSRRMAEVILHPVLGDRDNGPEFIILIGLDITDALGGQVEREKRLAAEAETLRHADRARLAELGVARESERRIRERLARLAGAALDLVHVERFEDVATITCHQGVPGLGATSGGLVIPADGQLRYATSDDDRGTSEIVYGWLPPDTTMPAAHVIRTGERLVFPDRASALEFSPVMDLVLRQRNCSSWVFVPLNVGGRRVGAMSISWQEEREISGEELELIDAFAAQCAQAIERIQVIESEREATARVQRMTQSLQRSLLTRPPAPPGLDVAATYLPAVVEAQVGGDWYDAFPTADGSLVLTVGDVAGHDGDAAATMAQLRNLLRGLSVGHERLPAEILRLLDRAIADLELDAIATALVARVEAGPTESRRVTWSSAGHLPPLVRHRDGSVEVLDDRPGLLLGVDPGAARVDRTLDLPEGAVLLLYTDGLVERRHEHLEEGIARLAAAFAGIPLGGADDISDRLVAALLPDAPQDDVAVLVLRPTGL